MTRDLEIYSIVQKKELISNLIFSADTNFRFFSQSCSAGNLHITVNINISNDAWLHVLS